MRVYVFIIVAFGFLGAFIGLMKYGGRYGMAHGMGTSLAIAVPVALLNERTICQV